jgi:hypothetical protein
MNDDRACTPSDHGFSRRSFIYGVTAVAAGSALLHRPGQALRALPRADHAKAATGNGRAPGTRPPHVVAGQANGVLFRFDRPTGVWRSTNHGQSWILIWPLTGAEAGARSGWLAANPTAAATLGGELWATTSGGLYRLTGADTGDPVGLGIKVTQVLPARFPFGAGRVAFAAGGGSPYVMALSGAPLTTEPRVLRRGIQGRLLKVSSPDGGTTWRSTVVAGASAGSPFSGDKGLS